MSAGTLTLTNSSASVIGDGTAFGTENKIGDFIVGYINGQSYSLAIASIESPTALTLTEVFYGPTTASVPWDSVPLRAITAIPYQLGVQHLKTLRLMNLESDNWLQLYTGTGDITVNIPDGRQYHGPSLLKLGASLDSKADKTALDNKANKGDNSDITSLLGLTTALSVKQGGTGSDDAWGAGANLKTVREQKRRFQSGDDPTSVEWRNSIGFMTGYIDNGYVGAFADFTSFDNLARMQIIGAYSSGAGNRHDFVFRVYNPNSKLWTYPARMLGSHNTTVDSNGFIKSASPVVNIFGDGQAKTNEESEGVTVIRTGTGEYLVRGCQGLNSDAAWGGFDGGFEIPIDRNKQPRIWIDYAVNEDGSITVKTFHRTHPQAPKFAQNIIEGVNDGDPVDIPADSFVSVRVEMPRDSAWNRKQEPKTGF